MAASSHGRLEPSPARPFVCADLEALPDDGYRREIIDPDGPFPATATPLLVVEVLAAGTAEQDRALKRAVYQALRVPAYWMVDPGAPTRARSLSALRLDGDRFAVEAEVADSNRFVTDWPFTVQVVPRELTT